MLAIFSAYTKKHLSLIVYFIIAIILVQGILKTQRWKDRIIDYDVAHYYGYLPSAFIYHDLSLEFNSADRQFLSNKIWYVKTIDGKKVFKVSMGVALGYLPGFLIAHGYQLITGGDASGFSAPYKLSLVMSGFFFAMLGLFYLRKILRLYFDEGISALVLLIIMLATNLFTYTVFEVAMSHVYSFAVITIFIWNTIQWYKKPGYARSIVLGLLIGWIFLIRPVNLLVMFIFVGWGINDMGSMTARIKWFLDYWKQAVIIAFFGFIICIPQLLYWKIYAGHWLFYSYVGEQFYFTHPHILEGLYSWRKGWLLYTPVMILSLIGIGFINKKIPSLRWIYPFTIGLLLYITWSWWCWWYGGGFGQRSLIDWYGWMAIPIAALLQSLKPKKIVYSMLIVFIFFCIFLNQFQHNQYRNTSIHYDSMTKDAYFYHFWKYSKYPGLTPLLIAPDYEKAKRGEKEYYWD